VSVRSISACPRAPPAGRGARVGRARSPRALESRSTRRGARGGIMAIEEGKEAPAFALQDGQGKKRSLADLRGREVILYFYPKDDTPGCSKEACGFRDHWREIEELGAMVLGVSPDHGESHEKFRAKYELPFPLLSDPDHKVMEK